MRWAAPCLITMITWGIMAHAGSRTQGVLTTEALEVERLMRVTVCPDGQRFALGKRTQGVQAKAIELTPTLPLGFIVRQHASGGRLEWVQWVAGEPRALSCAKVQGRSELWVASTVETGVRVETLDPRSGRVFWTAQVLEGDVQAEDLVVSAEGGAFVLSTGRGELAGTAARGQQDVVVQRLDHHGAPVWTQRFGTPDPDRGVRLALAGPAEVWVAGNTQGSFDGMANAGGQDGFLLRLEADSGKAGQVQMLGTDQNDVVSGLAVGPQGVYVAGFTYGSLVGKSNGEADAFVAGYTLEGDRRWLRQFGTLRADAFSAVVTLPDGDVLVAAYSDGDGQAIPPSQNRSSQLMRFQADGASFVVVPLKNASGASVLDLVADVRGRVYAVGLAEGAGLFASWSATLQPHPLLRLAQLVPIRNDIPR